MFTEEQIRALTEVCRRFGEVLTREVERLGRAGAPLVDAVWSAYREAGAPYGESEEGMLCWLSERRQIADLRVRAERLESMHETCAQLRARRGA